MEASRVLITSTSFLQTEGAHHQLLEEEGFQVIPNPHNRYLEESELRELGREADAIIVGVEPITRSVIDVAHRLRVISKYGVGYDNIDLHAAAERDIHVTYTPGVNADSVAELAIALVFSLARSIPTVHRALQKREWRRPIGIELAGKTLGIIGLGHIGKKVAERAVGLRMNVLAYDQIRDAHFARHHGIRYTDLDDLLAESDFITVHLTLSEATRNILSEEKLRRTKKGAFLINTARGELVDEDALHRVLKEGHLGGAGLDVYCHEPPFGSPLLALESVVCTSHIASKTSEAVRAQALKAAENVVAILSGHPERATHVPVPEA